MLSEAVDADEVEELDPTESLPLLKDAIAAEKLILGFDALFKLAGGREGGGAQVA